MFRASGPPGDSFAFATYSNPAWRLPGILTGIGGTLMVVGVMLFFVAIGLTIVAYGPFFLTCEPNFVSPGFRGY